MAAQLSTGPPSQSILIPVEVSQAMAESRASLLPDNSHTIQPVLSSTLARLILAMTPWSRASLETMGWPTRSSGKVSRARTDAAVIQPPPAGRSAPDGPLRAAFRLPDRRPSRSSVT